MTWSKLSVVQIISLVCFVFGLGWIVIIHEPLVYGKRADATVISSSYRCTGGGSRGYTRRCNLTVSVSYRDQNGISQSGSFYRLGHDLEKQGTVIPIKYLPYQPKEIVSMRLYEWLFDPSVLWFVAAVLVYVIGRPFEKMYLKDRNPFSKS